MRKNRAKQSEFLSSERKEGLERLFGAKGSDNKLKIEIGLQELKLTGKDKKKARNGKEMMVLKFWKAPVESNFRNTKNSYDTIDCYHMLQEQCYGEFDDNWFKSFTTCLDEKSFDKVKKNDKYLCLIQHVERLFVKDGEVMKYEQGDKIGEDIVIIEPQIINVYPIETNIETIKINYFSLYKPLNNDNSSI